MEIESIRKNNAIGDYVRSLKIKKIYIEMTNVCNFDCNFCPIRFSKRKPGRIRMDLFKKIVDEIAATGISNGIAFHVLGEPLIHPDLISAVTYASGKGLETSLTTNGALLSEDNVRGLCGTGLTYLGISLETTDEKEHESRGASISFPSYYKQIIKAIATIRKNSDIKVIINLMNTWSRKFFSVDGNIGVNIKENDFKNKLTDLVCDLKNALEIPVSRDEVFRDISPMKINTSQEIRINNKVEIYVQLFWDWGNAFTSKKIYPASIGYCGYAFKHIGILHDGRVTICCGDYDGGTSIGNVNDQPLTEILASDQARKLKAGFERNRLLHPYCQRCLGSTGRVKAFMKGVGSVVFFKLKGHPLDGVKKTMLSGIKKAKA